MNSITSFDDLQNFMAKGSNFETRLKAVAGLVRTTVNRFPGREFQNRDLVAQIMTDFGYASGGHSRIRRELARAISVIGKRDYCADIAHAGPLHRIQDDKQGNPCYGSDVVWRAAKNAEPEESVDIAGRTEESPAMSKTPQPGYTKVTCSQCSGSGRVYIKE